MLKSKKSFTGKRQNAKCPLETYEFNKCTTRLKMQVLSIVDFVFYVITFVLAYLMN